jgi:hypothetical protein
MSHEKSALREALEQADWEALLPGLLAYAAQRLRRVGWGAGRDIEPSKMSVVELVNTAVESCLSGVRVWNREAVDLPGFLRGVIRSLTSSEKKKAVRSKTDVRPDFDRLMPLEESPEDEVIEEENRAALLASIAECTKDDPDLVALYRVILEGSIKREEIAGALGWSVDRVTAARIKLQRRLVRHEPERFQSVREKQRRRRVS